MSLKLPGSNYLLHKPETNYFASLRPYAWNEIDSSENVWSTERWKSQQEHIKVKQNETLISHPQIQNCLLCTQIIKRDSYTSTVFSGGSSSLTGSSMGFGSSS